MSPVILIMDDDVNIEGVKKEHDLTFDLSSPRYLSTHIQEKSITFEAGLTVCYVFSEKSNDIYDQIYRCRLSKKNKHLVVFRGKNLSTVNQVLEAARPIYVLVSGGKLPEDAPDDEKNSIKKWMYHGLFIFNIYDEKKFGDSIIVSNETKAVITSSGNHIIEKHDSCYLDVNLLFVAMIIDYYEIRSGTHEKNAQISFMQDPNYRRTVYDKMKEVFCSFISMNGGNISSRGDTRNISAELITRGVVEILQKY